MRREPGGDEQGAVQPADREEAPGWPGRLCLASGGTQPQGQRGERRSQLFPGPRKRPAGLTLRLLPGSVPGAGCGAQGGARRASPWRLLHQCKPRCIPGPPQTGASQTSAHHQHSFQSAGVLRGREAGGGAHPHDPVPAWPPGCGRGSPAQTGNTGPIPATTWASKAGWGASGRRPPPGAGGKCRIPDLALSCCSQASWG